MALEETCRYIDHHTVRCGRPASIFADDAKADIHRHAGGVPRLVNAVCYRSILRAAVNDIRIIRWASCCSIAPMAALSSMLM